MTTFLDRLAANRRVISRVALGLGILAAAVYWWQLTMTAAAPVDAHAYWVANPDDLYPHPELLNQNGYNYSPAFELVIGWGRLLPFEVFVAIWRAVLLATLVWLAGPFSLLAMLFPPVAAEINAGNIQLLLATAIVLGFRYPATWAFVLLTKISPGVGLLWFALRREWRPLAWAVGVTVAIVLVTGALWPQRWLDYLRLLTAGSPPPVPPYNLSLWVRLPFAVAFVALGAWRGWRWPVVVGATIALPLFFFLSPSMFVGVLPYLRAELGRRLDARSGGTAATPAPGPGPAPAP